ncbi:MAG: rod shape-determining protein MreD [Deltaproteobacteria bacterium]|nr:rod shape-determining protein MreD [Deltaproteobacteria bacterium]
MRYGFYISICLFLLILQTTILPYIPVVQGMYDLLIPFVIFISICLPIRESLPFALALGLIMDNLSGSPFGMYLTFYLWLFIGVRFIIKFLRVSNKFFLSLVVIFAVLVQNILMIAIFAFFGPVRQLPVDAIVVVTQQFLWALATGPVFLLSLLALAKRLNIQWDGAAPPPNAYG